MTFFKLPQRSEASLNNFANFYKESVMQDAEFTEQILSVQDAQSFATLVVELSKQKGYYFTNEEMETLLTVTDDDEDGCWFEVADEMEFIDEEERSELEEMDEDRQFYSSIS
ncbi:MAG: hypothetical protein Fur006_53680 [Coleofasciculaceae cyanobacterium]